MNTALRILTIASILALSVCAQAQTGEKFERSALSGWWAESYNTDETCGPQNLRVRHEFSADGKRLLLRFDRKWNTELGETDKFEATVLTQDKRSFIIRYDGESRKKRNGQPVEWELTIVAPGVYRWRETGWPVGEVNTVVGIKCAD